MVASPSQLKPEMLPDADTGLAADGVRPTPQRLQVVLHRRRTVGVLIGMVPGLTLLSLAGHGAGIHEATIQPLLRITGRPGGVWQPTWVIIGVAIVVAVAAAFMRFIFHLPRSERRQVAAAAALYVLGAVGMEMVTAAFFTTSHPTYKVSFTYAVLAHIEELFEMLGVVVFIDFLLRRLSRTASISVAAGD